MWPCGVMVKALACESRGYKLRHPTVPLLGIDLGQAKVRETSTPPTFLEGMVFFTFLHNAAYW